MALMLRTLSRAFLASVLAASSWPRLAEGGHSARASEFAELVGQDAVAGQLLGELQVLLGHGSRYERLARFEDLLRPMYASLPKAEGGQEEDRDCVQPGVARNALNRFFLTNHGWHIRGIAPDGEPWNSSSSTTMLKSKMLTLILELLEEQVGHASLAATVESSIAVDRHGGSVPLHERRAANDPLHGRMSAQWMHHAYQNECPYPQAPSRNLTSSSSSARRAGASLPWSEEEASPDQASRAEETGNSTSSSARFAGASVPWREEEELLAGGERVGRRVGEDDGVVRIALRFLAMCGATFSLGSILLDFLRSSLQLRKKLQLKGWFGDLLLPPAERAAHAHLI